jgi:AcrR family transcriptional regulator
VSSRENARPRRAPEPEQRQRDAERTRERILAAATEEISAHGYAGARVANIAARAGVNQQLISYYFGGKQGLYDALNQRWLAEEATFANPGRSVEEIIAGYFDATAAQPAGARLLLWQALGDVSGGSVAAQEAEIADNVIDDLRRRQREGELTSDYDAEFILLVVWSAIMAQVAAPHVVRGAYQADPGSAEFRERFLPQLQRLFREKREYGTRAG